tara:strand:- start:118 stop:783 length:666 start_codon:yes stop_codon:yes gene_type:complete
MSKKKNLFLFVIFFLLLTTFNKTELDFKENIFFQIKQVEFVNNKLLNDNVKEKFLSLKGRNLLKLSKMDIDERVKDFPFISHVKINKIYPDMIRIEIFEKKIIANLFDGKEKFHIDDRGNFIDLNNLKRFDEKPSVFGGKEYFFPFYKNLVELNFPINKIHSFYFFEIGRWDIKTKQGIIIKLPAENYSQSIKNFLSNYENFDFKNFKTFDYRVKKELIIK